MWKGNEKIKEGLLKSGLKKFPLKGMRTYLEEECYVVEEKEEESANDYRDLGNIS